MARWDAQLMQDEIDRMVDRLAGTGYEQVAAGVAAAWEAVAAELQMRAAGIELAISQLALTYEGLTGLVAPGVDDGGLVGLST